MRFYSDYVLLFFFLPPQGLGPDGQNSRRQPRGPRVLGRKIWQLQKKSRFFKNRARKVLPKSTQAIAEKFARYCRNLGWGSKKHSKESGSEVFARDSEVEAYTDRPILIGS